MKVSKKIENRVKNLIWEQCGNHHIYLSSSHLLYPMHVFNDLNCDSLDHVEMAMFMEEEFDIEIMDDEWAKFLTVGQMIKYINRRVTHKKETNTSPGITT